MPLLSGPRALTKLDVKILEEVLAPLAPVLDPAFSIAGVELNRSAAHALLPPGKAILAELSCSVMGIGGKASFARLSTSMIDEDAASSAPPAASHLITQLTARIARLNVSVSNLSDLKAGSVLLLGLPTDQPVELLSGGHDGHVIAEGDVGRRGNKMAIRVTRKIS